MSEMTGFLCVYGSVCVCVCDFVAFALLQRVRRIEEQLKLMTELGEAVKVAHQRTEGAVKRAEDIASQVRVRR